MSGAAQSRAYWDRNATAFNFGHPIRFEWLAELPKQARILDFGCGYGRALAELKGAGWTRGVGVDLSGEMVARGLAEHPDLDLRQIDGRRLAEPDGAFDAAIVFAVLTTIVATADQDAVMAELRRLVKPAGLIYVSDYGLQPDARYADRYRRGFERYGEMGVWDREDGGVFRHQTRERLAELMAGFELIAEREVETRTLSGASAIATQLLGRRGC